MAQEQLLTRVIEALRTTRVRGVVTTGLAIDPAALPAPPNVLVVRSAPHGRLFADADVVVTHAGMGTVTRALSSGVPLVCLPMGRDQHDVAARVVYAGAGIRLRPSAKPAAIRAAVERVTGDPGFAAAARNVGAGMNADAEAGMAVAELEALASGTREQR
jgi:UDP:flavonoid glycosyltransferase YjiC (YdhE family)